MVNQTNLTNTSSGSVNEQQMATTTPTAQLSVINYIWNYVMSTIGEQATLPPIWWSVTALLLASILFCYQRRPQMLTIEKGGLSTPILLMLFNHLLNNSVFLINTYLLSTVVNYKEVGINVSSWLHMWWSFCKLFIFKLNFFNKSLFSD